MLQNVLLVLAQLPLVFGEVLGDVLGRVLLWSLLPRSAGMFEIRDLYFDSLRVLGFMTSPVWSTLGTTADLAEELMVTFCFEKFCVIYYAKCLEKR